MPDTPMTHRNGYRTDGTSAVEFVAVQADPRTAEGSHIDPALANRLMIDVIHDGDWIPDEFLVDSDGEPIPDEAFIGEHWDERDWGACMVAEGLCRKLGIPGYHRINIARVIMDFGRFPGLTRQDAGHLDRFALNYPFSEMLGFRQQRAVLERYYDEISAHFESAVSTSITKIAIHTYDLRNDSGTVRPEISVLTRSTSYQHESEMPFGVFDPMYPDVLAEYTADRVLRDRISLTFEKAGYTVAHNYPYTLPDGSIEVRAQVWSFFVFLRRRFIEEFPDCQGAPGFEMVWRMLLDTNLRSAESEALRSYLFMFRRVSAEADIAFSAARTAYERVFNFLRATYDDLVTEFRLSAERMSTLGIEVRKDLVYDFDNERIPTNPNPEGADAAATVLARAIHTYFAEDRPTKVPPREFHFHGHDP